jgi:NitT/TauT family transport system substrate-binding protein
MKIRLWLTAVAAVFGISVLAGDLACAQSPRRVVIAHGSQQVEITHPGLYLGGVLGFAQEEGIDLVAQTTQGSQQALQLMAAGRADFVQVTTETIINARDQGVNARIVYSAVAHYNAQIAALADGPVRAVTDLRGRQVGVFSLASGGVPYLKAVLRESGLDPERDVTLVPTGAGAPALQALRNGTVGALSLWAGAFAVFENQGARLRIFTSRELSAAPGHILATTDEFLRQNPDVVARVGRIYARSAVFAMANPRATVRLYWQALPQNRPPEINDTVAGQAQHILEVGLRDMRVDNRPDTRWGWNNPTGLRALQNFLVANGARTTIVPDEQLFSNEQVDQYNRFDAAAVRARAASM